MGIVEEAREKSEARRNKPQPWIVRKLAVFITIAIIAYTWYVYVGRLCVPMIRRDAGALGSRGLGSKFIHLDALHRCTYHFRCILLSRIPGSILHIGTYDDMGV